MPVEGDPSHITAGEHSRTNSPIEEKPQGAEFSTTSLALTSTRPNDVNSARPSFEITAAKDPRGRSSTEGRRPSAISFSDAAPAVSQASRTPSPGKSSHSRSGSDTLSRTTSRTADGIGRTLSKLGKKKSREAGHGISHDAPVAEVQVREVSDLSTVSSETQPQPQPYTKANTLSIAPPPQKIRHPVPPQPVHATHKRDKSKNRLSKGNGKGKDRHPDRECVVM